MFFFQPARQRLQVLTTTESPSFLRFILVSGLLWLFFFGLPSDAAASALHKSNTTSLSAEEQGLLNLRLTRQRNRNSLNQVYQFDHTPLGKRIPVILVPGRAEEFQQNSWWKGVYKDSQKNPLFRHNFKVYVFLYNSKEELDVQAAGLATDLKKYFGHLPSEQPLMLVTYSLGGVISREILAEQTLLDRVDTMIAIAVPFHGSPLFDPSWFSEYMNPPNRSPIRRFWDRTIYRGYMFGKSNLTRGLRWDNFDSSKPQFHSDNTEVVGDLALSKIPPYEEYPLADAIREKTIVYASYLENGYTNSNQPFNPIKLPKYVLNNSLTLPKELAATVLPVYGFTVHSVFTYMNNQMANIPTYTPDDPQGRNTHLYRFNDGAIPLSSMLFLKPRQHPYDDDLWSMISQATLRKVRIFVNLDHMDVGEYNLMKHKLVKPDLVHPEEDSRSPNEWIIQDLIARLEKLRFGGQQENSNPAPPSETSLKQSPDSNNDKGEIKQTR